MGRRVAGEKGTWERVHRTERERERGGGS